MLPGGGEVKKANNIKTSKILDTSDVPPAEVPLWMLK